MKYEWGISTAVKVTNVFKRGAGGDVTFEMEEDTFAVTVFVDDAEEFARLETAHKERRIVFFDVQWRVRK